MFEPIDLQEKLIQERKKEVKADDIIGWAYSVLNDDPNKSTILQRLSKSPIERNINNFHIDKLDTDAIFHITTIRKICIDYRLRFLDTKYFKGSYPKEVVSKITKIERDNNTILDGFGLSDRGIFKVGVTALEIVELGLIANAGIEAVTQWLSISKEESRLFSKIDKGTCFSLDGIAIHIHVKRQVKRKDIILGILDVEFLKINKN